MQNNEDALNRIVNRFSAGLQGDVRKAIKRMYNLLDHGTKVEKATSILQNEYPKLFQLAGLEDALVEAAAYGYGIMPEVMTTDDEEIISSVVRKPWSADGMTLSEKLHGTSEAMRRAIIETVTEQVRKNATTIQMARELYNGYNSGVGVINQQKLPAYINRMVRNQGGEGNRRAIEKAVKNVEKQAQNGAPNRAQKAAYKQLIDAVEQGNEKAIEKAVKVAIEEKTRYVAERIARTEMAKAYADGFFSKWDKDDDAVAYQFKLGTRHPKFDICDMFASCDMFNLGVGVYPKDQVPDVPIHPHCLCKYKVLFKGQVKMNNQRDQRTEAMAKWVDQIDKKDAKAVLGKAGYEKYQNAGSLDNIKYGENLSNPNFREIDIGGETISKNIVIPSKSKSGFSIDGTILKSVQNAIDDMQKRFDIPIDEAGYARLPKKYNNVPFQWIATQNVGDYKNAFVINMNYSWNNNLDLFNERIYTLYRRGEIASKDVVDLVKHEMAHFMIYKDCSSFQAVIDLDDQLNDLLFEYKKAGYLDGLPRYIGETGSDMIAESFVLIENGETIHPKLKDLVDKYVMGSKKK